MMVHQIARPSHVPFSHIHRNAQPDLHLSSVTAHMPVCHTPYPSVVDLCLPFGPIFSPVVFPKHMYVPITYGRRGRSIITAHCLILKATKLPVFTFVINLSLECSLQQNEINSNEDNMNRCFSNVTHCITQPYLVIHIVPCITKLLSVQMETGLQPITVSFCGTVSACISYSQSILIGPPEAGGLRSLVGQMIIHKMPFD